MSEQEQAFRVIIEGVGKVQIVQDSNMHNATPKSTLKNKVETVESVSRNGFTWTFSEARPVLWSVGGNPVVRGPVTIVSAETPDGSLSPTVLNNSTINGSEINPRPDGHNAQGLDGRSTHTLFDDSKTVQFPVTINKGSIITAQSHNDPNKRPILERIGTLVVVDTDFPVEGNWIAPSYLSDDPQFEFDLDSVDLNKFANIEPSHNISVLYDSLVNTLSVSPVFHYFSWQKQYIQPNYNLASYGRETATLLGWVELLLNTKMSETDKKTLLGYYLEFANTFWYVFKHMNNVWDIHGGHSQGQYFPILMLSHLFDRDDILSLLQSNKMNFSENFSTFFVNSAMIGMVLNPDSRDSKIIQYSTDDVALNMPEWGIDYEDNPHKSNKFWHTYYRECCTFNSLVGQALSAHLMRIQDKWNHPPFFEYIGRYLRVQDHLIQEGKASDWTRCWRSYPSSGLRFDVWPIWQEFGWMCSDEVFQHTMKTCF